MIELGATTLVIPGNFPIGCVPQYLSEYKSATPEDYDSETGCLNWLNELSEYHDSLLLDEINLLRKIYPHITIIYADYYEATLNIYRHPHQFGMLLYIFLCYYDHILCDLSFEAES